MLLRSHPVLRICGWFPRPREASNLGSFRPILSTPANLLHHLVTGTAGFIGFHVAKRLLARGDTVVGLDVVNDYYDVQLKEDRLAILGESDRYEHVRINLVDRTAVDDVFAKHRFDRVVHLAAQAGVRFSIENPHAYTQSNVVGFLNVIEGCRHQKVPHLTYASSSSVYGGCKTMPFSVTDRVDHPLSLYAATKKSNELMAHTYSHLYGLPTTGLRFFSVYGPWGRPDMALFLFTKAIIEGRAINVFNQGNMLRDFTYVDDIVSGVEKTSDLIAKPNPDWDPTKPDASSSSAPYRLYNIGNNTPIKLMDFIDAIEDAIGIKARRNLLPLQPGDVAATYANIDALSDAVGFTPATPIGFGIGKFVQWYREYYNV